MVPLTFFEVKFAENLNENRLCKRYWRSVSFEKWWNSHSEAGLWSSWRKTWTRLHRQWSNRRGGAECPSETSDWEIFADISGKKETRGKRVKIEKKRRKIVKGKGENWKYGSRKSNIQRADEDLFFFFFFFFAFTFENDGNLFWVYQNGNFLLGKIIRKNDFALSEKYAWYAPVHRFQNNRVKGHVIWTAKFDFTNH